MTPLKAALIVAACFVVVLVLSAFALAYAGRRPDPDDLHPPTGGRR